MSIRVEVFDGVNPMLEQIALVSREVTLEVLSASGAKIQKEARAAMRRKSHSWMQYVGNGKRHISKMDGLRFELGQRMSHETGQTDNPDSMSNFITSYLMEKPMTVVVGGRHKSFTPKKRRDGKVVGTLKKVNAVSKSSHAILHKLNFGERLGTHSWGGEKESMKRFANAKYVAQNFMDEGYNNARSGVVETMTKRYEMLLGKVVNRADVKVVKKVI